MNKIVLEGCTSTPLASYLKSLGILRMLSVKDGNLRAAWHGDQFVLNTTLEPEAIAGFFLEEYKPTPVMAPWNGGSGFYYQERKSKEKDSRTGKKKKLGIFDQKTTATKVVSAIQASTNPRFSEYRDVLRDVKALIKNKELITAPDAGEEKDTFIVELRNTLSDPCAAAMDAGVVVANMEWQSAPLVGTGWNDGNLDFTNNFMQRLAEVINLEEGEPPKASVAWLQSALFATPAPNLVNKAIGQFSPGQAGGPNASTGFDANAGINPWDYILMIEGALLFAAATVRRNASDPGALSYPFTVRAVGAGSGSLGEGDLSDARGELWMPLWDRFASIREIRALMSEGRVSLDRKPARDALDFARAVHQLGGYRGIRSFQRFGLLMRSGRAYLATPLARVEVTDEPQGTLLDALDQYGWLDRFRQFARGEHAPQRFKLMRRQLEDRLFDLSGRAPAPADMQSLIALLGQIQTVLANSNAAQEKVPPVPRLSEQWLTKADDKSVPFRIARAIAGLRGSHDQLLPLRAQLFPMERQRNRWLSKESDRDVRTCCGTKARLVDTLIGLLTQRLQLKERLQMDDKPLASPAGVTLADIAAFLQNPSMDKRIAELLPGLSLCNASHIVNEDGQNEMLPAAFGLMKLAITPDHALQHIELDRHALLGENERMPIPVGMVAKLAAGNAENRAVKTAWRRLRSSGLSPLFTHPDALPEIQGEQAKRMAAALLIPLRWTSTRQLARAVLTEPESESVTTD